MRSHAQKYYFRAKKEMDYILVEQEFFKSLRSQKLEINKSKLLPFVLDNSTLGISESAFILSLIYSLQTVFEIVSLYLLRKRSRYLLHCRNKKSPATHSRLHSIDCSLLYLVYVVYHNPKLSDQCKLFIISPILWSLQIKTPSFMSFSARTLLRQFNHPPESLLLEDKSLRSAFSSSNSSHTAASSPSTSAPKEQEASATLPAPVCLLGEQSSTRFGAIGSFSRASIGPNTGCPRPSRPALLPSELRYAASGGTTPLSASQTLAPFARYASKPSTDYSMDLSSEIEQSAIVSQPTSANHPILSIKPPTLSSDHFICPASDHFTLSTHPKSAATSAQPSACSFFSSLLLSSSPNFSSFSSSSSSSPPPSSSSSSPPPFSSSSSSPPPFSFGPSLPLSVAKENPSAGQFEPALPFCVVTFNRSELLAYAQRFTDVYRLCPVTSRRMVRFVPASSPDDPSSKHAFYVKREEIHLKRLPLAALMGTDGQTAGFLVPVAKKLDHVPNAVLVPQVSNAVNCIFYSLNIPLRTGNSTSCCLVCSNTQPIRRDTKLSFLAVFTTWGRAPHSSGSAWGCDARHDARHCVPLSYALRFHFPRGAPRSDDVREARSCGAFPPPPGSSGSPRWASPRPSPCAPSS